jgi:hypothetical protein
LNILDNCVFAEATSPNKLMTSPRNMLTEKSSRIDYFVSFPEMLRESVNCMRQAPRLHGDAPMMGTRQTFPHPTMPPSSQDSLRDAVFARPNAPPSLAQEKQPAGRYIRVNRHREFSKGFLPLKSGESLAHAIDTVLTSARRKK